MPSVYACAPFFPALTSAKLPSYLAIAFNKVVYYCLASMFLVGSRKARHYSGDSPVLIRHSSNFAQSDYVAAALHPPGTISTMGTMISVST